MSESIADWGSQNPPSTGRVLGMCTSCATAKGEWGKTTMAAHVGALVASDGGRTLIVDLNGQGNIAELMGFAYGDRDDNGRNLFSAVTAGAPLNPVRDVRPNLDVVLAANSCAVSTRHCLRRWATNTTQSACCCRWPTLSKKSPGAIS